MGRKRIADHIADALRREGTEWVCWGDGILCDVARPLLRGRAAAHPLNAITAACDAMERAPDLFEKHLMHGHDSRTRARVVRAFRLIAPEGE